MTDPMIEGRVKELEMWMSGHVAQYNERWSEQRHHNKRIELVHDKFDRRITAVERKVIWWAGAAAAIGAILGPYITTFFSGG